MGGTETTCTSSTPRNHHHVVATTTILEQEEILLVDNEEEEKRDDSIPRTVFSDSLYSGDDNNNNIEQQEESSRTGVEQGFEEETKVNDHNNNNVKQKDDDNNKRSSLSSLLELCVPPFEMGHCGGSSASVIVNDDAINSKPSLATKQSPGNVAVVVRKNSSRSSARSPLSQIAPFANRMENVEIQFSTAQEGSHSFDPAEAIILQEPTEDDLPDNINDDAQSFVSMDSSISSCCAGVVPGQPTGRRRRRRQKRFPEALMQSEIKMERLEI